MDEQLIKLQVVGVSRNNLQLGAYALLLEEVDGTRRMPVVIGTAEAQSIAVRLEGIIPPRPLTHDLMSSVFHAFSIELEKVVITSVNTGVFTAELTLHGEGGKSTVLDSRTSDAIALALRTGAPIFTTKQVLETSGYDTAGEKGETTGDAITATRLEDLPTERLEARLQHHVDNEEYEQAARIKKIIESRSAR